MPIPQANVVESGPISLQIESFSRSLSIEIALFDAVDTEGAAGPGNVLFDVRRLATELVRLYDEVGYIGGNDNSANDVNDQRNGDDGND